MGIRRFARLTPAKVVRWLRRAQTTAALGGYLESTGWMRSRREGVPVGADGSPLPWITQPAIDLLSERVGSSWRVFEYGAGNSTLWWAQRVAEVVAVEHDRRWVDILQPPANVTIIHADRGSREYIEAPGGQRFHVVVIDGRDRVKCSRFAVSALREDGVLVWDNSDREAYTAGAEYLKEQGMRQLRMRGLAPGLAAPTETSLFYRDGNCLRL